jgi:tRNA pseudouridine38-40 synthase
MTLAYHGAGFCGWQRQPKDLSVQEVLEQALATILRQEIEITGCGRTDAGVHARYYVAHFDGPDTLPPTLLYSINSLLPDGVSLYHVAPVHATAHARYDAYERSYEYHISWRKDPFSTETAWFFPQYARVDVQKMQDVAHLLLQYDSFFPFCKTHSGLDHFDCVLKKAQWVSDPEAHKWVFYISANRFLRGMVRLIVGACVQVGTGKISLAEVQRALDQQVPLHKSLSVPPTGLFLTDVKYPFDWEG